MGCGSSSAQAPGKASSSDPDMDECRMVYDKKTGAGRMVDAGKDEDGQECDFFEVEEAEGEQFMAVRPWIGQITEPDNHNEINNEKPDTTYELEYVYGYRCADSRQNVYFNCNGQPTYMTAALGVILDPASNTQKFFGGGEVESTAKNVANDLKHHTDDIMCIRVNEARTTAVSGQVGSKPTIFKWDACTGEMQQRIKIAKGARGIQAVSINAEGWIAAVDLHNEHQVYCYDPSGNMVFKQAGSQSKILDICWDEKPGSTRFATAGKDHCCFWDSSKPGEKKKGIFGGKGEMTSFACVAACSEGKFYTGGSNSEIYIWGDDRQLEKTWSFHGKGFICALRWAEGKLYSGGKDGKVNCIDTSTGQVVGSMSFPTLVRAVDCHDGAMVVGTRDGTITICHGDNKKAIMSSHSDGEVWGLDKNAEGCIVTSGDDNKVMKWNPKDRRHVDTVEVSQKRQKSKRGRASTLSRYPESQCSRAVAINGDWIAVAGNDGTVTVRSASSPGTCAHELRDSDEWIEVMAFSPDNQWLAVGSHDNNIYVYEVNNGFSLKGTCRGHNSYIMAMDWCAHSKYIRSNCGAYELLFFTVPDCQQDKSGRSNTTSTVWATKTVKFSWDTQGIYPKGCDGTHINSVAGSSDGQLLATGDDYGLVNLFRDPCIKGRPRSYRGHSEHVVRVMFSADDSNLYSIGGYDQTLMQWKRC